MKARLNQILAEAARIVQNIEDQEQLILFTYSLADHLTDLAREFSTPIEWATEDSDLQDQ